MSDTPVSPIPPVTPAATPAVKPAVAPVAAQVGATIEDFRKIELKIGVILKAEAHPNADRLYVVQVDLGNGDTRQLVAGIKQYYTPEQLVGKHVVVVANLAPATLRGVESRGMILAAGDGTKLVVVSPEQPIAPGSTVK